MNDKYVIEIQKTDIGWHIQLPEGIYADEFEHQRVMHAVGQRIMDTAGENLREIMKSRPEEFGIDYAPRPQA